MPDYVVTVVATSRIVVQDAQSEEEAMNLAFENAKLSEFDIDEVDACSEIIGVVEFERQVRHANQVI